MKLSLRSLRPRHPLIWLMRASRTNNAGEATALGKPTRLELYGSDLQTETFDYSTSKRETREES
jgi:hypothetical protein